MWTPERHHLIRNVIFKAMLVVVAAAACWGLLHGVGRWTGLALWIALMGAACATSAMILRTAKVGELSWKNRQAGYFLPWGYGLAGGKLQKIALFSWLGWVLVGLGVAVMMAPTPSVAPTPTATASSAGPVWRWLVFGVWAINTSAIIYLLGTLVKNFSPGSSSGRSLIKVMALMIIFTSASVALHSAGYPRWAVLIGGAPMGLLGLFFGLYIGLILGASAVGKPVRWN